MNQNLNTENKVIDILIPRKILFGNPDKSAPNISPDGKKLAFIAPKNNVLNIFVQDLSNNKIEQITHDTDRGITAYQWHFDSEHIFFIQDTLGNENWRLYKISTMLREQICFTPFDNVQVQLIDKSRHKPNDLLIAMNKENPELHDVYHLNVETGEITLRVKNPGNVTDYLSDYNLNIRGSLVSKDDGGFELHLRENENDEFKLFYSWSHADSANSGPLIFDKSGKYIYILDSTYSNVTRFVKIEIESGNQTIIFEDAQQTYDISWVIIHPDSLKIQIIAVTKDKEEVFVLDKSIEKDIDLIKKFHPDYEFFLGNRNLDDTKWIIGYIKCDGPVPYYIFDRNKKEFQFLFYHHEALNNYLLTEIEPISLKSRDGLDLHGYISFPNLSDRNNLPMVVNVHGGPWSRDTYSLDPEVQLFTNRGYISLQINFRGSSGYGKEFLNAGDKEWGGNILNDIVDAVNWAIDKGYADSTKIAIYGGSFGGYAALAGAAFTDIFCCAVDIVGPSNLITFINSIPDYWKPFLSMLHKRVGNPETEEEFLKSISPLFHVKNIKIPLLIAHGANDPRVKQEESEQIVAVLKEKKIPHIYMLFEDEGHGLVKPENRLKFYKVLELFLSENLGGLYEK